MREFWGISCLIATALWISGALAHDDAPTVAYILAEDESGTVLAESRSTQPRYPASLTKVMTAYMVFRAAAQDRLDLNDEVTISRAAAAQPPTKLGLTAGSKVRISILLEAMILRSANDAAVALAEAVSGSEEHFAISMTRQARALGMTQSAFKNATGLPDAGQVTSARDLAILVQALIREFPEHYALFRQRYFSYKGKIRPTMNAWVRGYTGAEGFKTGFTCGSGYNLLGAATRNGQRLIAVVLGAKSSGERYALMTKLMDGGFAKSAMNVTGGLRLTALRGEMKSTAPYVFSDGSCPVAVTPVEEAALRGQLPGWGVLFGSFVNRTEAHARIVGNRVALEEVVSAGKPAIVARRREKPPRYGAFLVDLSEDGAGQACRHLQALGINCLVVPPKLLNDPKALWGQ